MMYLPDLWSYGGKPIWFEYGMTRFTCLIRIVCSRVWINVLSTSLDGLPIWLIKYNTLHDMPAWFTENSARLISIVWMEYITTCVQDLNMALHSLQAFGVAFDKPTWIGSTIAQPSSRMEHRIICYAQMVLICHWTRDFPILLHCSYVARYTCLCLRYSYVARYTCVGLRYVYIARYTCLCLRYSYVARYTCLIVLALYVMLHGIPACVRAIYYIARYTYLCVRHILCCTVYLRVFALCLYCTVYLLVFAL